MNRPNNKAREKVMVRETSVGEKTHHHVMSVRPIIFAAISTICNNPTKPIPLLLF